MPVPTQDDLHRPILEFAAESGEGTLSFQGIMQFIRELYALTDDDMDERTSSGTPRIQNNLSFAKSCLKKAGLIASPKRAQFHITPEGQQFLQVHDGRITKHELNQLADAISQENGWRETSAQTAKGSDMPVPAQNELHRPVLEFVAESGGNVVSLQDIGQFVKELFALSDEDADERVPSGFKRFDSRLRFAMSYLRRAGLVASPKRAHFHITPEGHQFLQDHNGLITVTQLKKLADAITPTNIGGETYAEQTKAGVSVAYADAPHKEQIAVAYGMLQAQLADDMLARLKNIGEREFNRLVAILLNRMGYGECRRIGGGGGIDGVVSQDALGLESVYVQAKRCGDAPVGQAAVRDFIGSLAREGVNKGALIATSDFSAAARQLAQNVSAGNQSIRLIDGRELARLMIEHGVGVVAETTYEVKKLDENFFS